MQLTGAKRDTRTQIRQQLTRVNQRRRRRRLFVCPHVQLPAHLADATRPQIERQFDSFAPLSIWHTLIIIFVTYAMMPMALPWSFLCSLASSLIDLLLALRATIQIESAPTATALSRCAHVLIKLLVYLTINLVCLYTRYLIDLAQRNAFLETRRSIDTRAKIERENDKQERLLLSLLPRFVALEIITDIAKEDDHDKLLRNQFHKIYIHSYSNVRLVVQVLLGGRK